MSTMPVSREKLFEEVWAEPMVKVAVRYGVSSSFMARVCNRLNVPKPARGHWAKLAVGHGVPRPELPAPRPGDELEWSRDGNPRRSPIELLKAPATPRTRMRRQVDRPSRHELTREGRQYFDEAKQSDRGYLLPTKRRLLDLFVTQSTLDRAFDAANKLFLSLEDRGHRVTLPRLHEYQRKPIDERIVGGSPDHHWGSGNADRPTVVFIGTVAIGLAVFELSEKVEVRYVDGKYVPVDDLPVSKRRGWSPNSEWTHMSDLPTGRLCIRASSPYAGTIWEKQWRESKAGQLGKLIPRIVRTLEDEADGIAVLVEERRRQAEAERQRWEVEHERWMREENERRRIQCIKESKDELFAIVESWGVAERIESFFKNAERRALDLGEADRASILERLHSARALLGGTDALQWFRTWKVPEER